MATRLSFIFAPLIPDLTAREARKLSVSVGENFPSSRTRPALRPLRNHRVLCAKNL